MKQREKLWTTPSCLKSGSILWPQRLNFIKVRWPLTFSLTRHRSAPSRRVDQSSSTRLVGRRPRPVLGQLLCPFTYRPFSMTSPEWTQLERLSSCITEGAEQRPPHLFSIYNPDLHPAAAPRRVASSFPRLGRGGAGCGIHHGPERSFLSHSSISALRLPGEESDNTGWVTWNSVVRGQNQQQLLHNKSLSKENLQAEGLCVKIKSKD